MVFCICGFSQLFIQLNLTGQQENIWHTPWTLENDLWCSEIRIVSSHSDFQWEVLSRRHGQGLQLAHRNDRSRNSSQNDVLDKRRCSCSKGVPSKLCIHIALAAFPVRVIHSSTGSQQRVLHESYIVGETQGEGWRCSSCSPEHGSGGQR